MTGQRLYHFTTATTGHLGSILTDGHLRTTESNVSFTELDAGPRVVWLTDRAESDAAGGATWGNPRFPEARITVAVDDAEPWGAFFARHGGTDEVRDALVDTAGGEGAARTWYVVPRRIFADEWTALDLSDGRHFDAPSLLRLTRSAGARRALALPRVRVAADLNRVVQPPG